MFIKFIILWVFDVNCVPRRKTINYEFTVGSQPRLSSNVSHIFLNIIKFLYYYQTPLRCDSVAVFFLWHTFCSVWTSSVVFVAGLFNDYLSILKVRIGQYLTANVYRKYELIQGFYTHLNKTYDRLKVNPSQDQ